MLRTPEALAELDARARAAAAPSAAAAAVAPQSSKRSASSFRSPLGAIGNKVGGSGVYYSGQKVAKRLGLPHSPSPPVAVNTRYSYASGYAGSLESARKANHRGVSAFWRKF